MDIDSHCVNCHKPVDKNTEYQTVVQISSPLGHIMVIIEFRRPD
jgi:hypothetical protein